MVSLVAELVRNTGARDRIDAISRVSKIPGITVTAEALSRALVKRYTAPMRIILTTLLLLPALAQAASIRQQNSITCISDKSSLQGSHKEFVARKNSEKVKSWFSEWMMAENFGNMKSKIFFTWKPNTPKGPAIDIDTTDKAHNLIQIRSKTKNSLVVVTSASNSMSTESWTFGFNFEVETVIATRVQSNIGGVKGEVITYDCHFESLELEGLGANEESSAKPRA